MRRRYDGRASCEILRPGLNIIGQEMGEQEVEVFRRKWEIYILLPDLLFSPQTFHPVLFHILQARFAPKTLGDAIMTAGREGAMELMEGVPL
jgi:cyclopropane-fatty-acyl-phospholipid synthase